MKWVEDKLIPTLAVAIVFGLFTTYIEVQRLKDTQVDLTDTAKIAIKDGKKSSRRQNSDIIQNRERIIKLESELKCKKN